ncbi:hypothetical protein C0992_010529 [Termitomyces sp. T32_za158]|nr:hypothetical protein C0992_010529 [Termitomyces sp. T32_za158]
MPSKPVLRMRTWGTRFDTLPTSPPLSPSAPDPAVAADASGPPATDPTPKRKDEKMPHDASVFVGSLPSNIDQQELTRLLSEHLSEHTEVKNIKVVRDSKGGVCAFVQCEDAASAASLINTLHSNTPKQFLGRALRYEPARAFRTLLISYRTPMQQIPVNSLDAHSKPQLVELNLPTAMRVWRPGNSKFYSLLYNNEAVDAENGVRNDLAVTSDKPSLFLEPVVFDAEAINTIASYFGPLENISRLQLTKNVTDPGASDVIEDWKLYPSPHDAPRSAKMDTACWEIKWEHRDDCVSALMTLRRVPHLTVTWAHQPPPPALENRFPYMSFPHPNLAQYPIHVQDRLQFARGHPSSLTDSFGFSRPLVKTRDSSKSTSEHGTTSDTASETDVAYPDDSLTDATPVRWSDMDFPPLGNTKGSLKAGSGVWSERQPEIGRNRYVILGMTAEITFFNSIAKKDACSYSMSCLNLEDEKEIQDRGQELDIPSTPGLGRSPLTPKTPGFPPTPTNTYNALPSMSLKDRENKNNGYPGDPASRERDIDPTTLFVGGLETFGPGAWDEEKLTKLFARFGGLEEVKMPLLVPSSKKCVVPMLDIALQSFNSIMKHNRVYEGRAMRVQLRDCNPSRSSWRHNRGRGYLHQQKFGPYRRAQEDQADRTSSQDNRIQDGQSQASQSSQEDKTAAEAGFLEAGPPVYTEIAASKAPADAPEDDEVAGVSSTEATAASSNSSTPFTTISTQPAENYREWYDEPLSTTPSLSTSLNSPASMPTSTQAMPYPVPYYTPTPWIPPYGPPMPFHMPYVGFHGYPFPNQSQPPQFQRPPGSDGNTAAVPGTWSPMGMYGAPPPRTPTVEQTQSQPNLNNKAPLYPTGFIQNEQGTLIAVYQPEALDQYMAGAPAAPPPQYLNQNLPNWTPYPQPAGYPAPGGPPPTTAMPVRQTHPSNNMAWIPNQGFAPQQQAHTTPHMQQTPHLAGPAGGPRGGYPESGGQTGGPPFRRHPGRQGGPHNNHTRNSQPRSFQNRNARGNIPMNSGYHGVDAQSGLRNSHLTGTEWSPWGVTAPR